MFTFHYLRDHINAILMQLVFICIFIVVFYLYHLPLVAILYPAGICFIVGCLFMTHEILAAYKKHEKLTALLSLQGSTILEMFEECAKTEERDYQKVIQKLCQDMQHMEMKMTDAYKETIDYFTMWVHQIKTPIASMRLHLDAEDSKLSRRLKSDLLHIEQYVEMVTTYIKIGSDMTDYVFRTVYLDKILRENIRKLRSEFILKKINLIYNPTNEAVISDEKWLSFVIEQILSNALKYTEKGSVTISIEDPKTLCISDTGIGIAPEDILRIFDKGYTGKNGRADKRASGLGLYLCRQICNQLGHSISAISEVEKGTTIKIDLMQYYRVQE